MENRKVNILMVDDTPANLFALRAILNHEDYNLLEATSGADALRILLTEEVAVVLLDVVMPLIDGFETARMLRARAKTREVPIIFVTSFSYEEAQIFKGYSVGAVDYILTPIVPEILRAKVSTFVALFRQTQIVREQAAGLQWSESRFRRLADATFEAIVLLEDGKIIDGNRALEKFYGYSVSELVGQGLSFLTTEKYARFVEDRAQSDDERPFEKTAVKKDGTIFPVEVSIKDLSSGERSRRVVAIRDISDRKTSQELRRLAENLTRSNEELERFAAVASHDLKEPLRMIYNYLGLLQSRYSHRIDAEGTKLIECSLDGARRMQGLIEDLLNFSHLTNTKDPVEKVDCNELVRVVLNNLQVAIVSCEANIEIGNLPQVNVVSSQLVQVFQNLLDNALKYRGEQRPQISVSAVRKGQEWVFAVKDNGIGFEQKNAHKIFEMFGRLHSKSEYAGTGIGLATCKKIIENHGGRIWTESSPGRGAIFFFTLPEIIKVAPLQGMKILLVDDAKEMRHFFGEHLLGDVGGAEVDVAENGEQGVKMAAGGTYDLILMDIQMPVLDGIEATRELRTFNQKVPIVAFTGHRRSNDREFYRNEGFTDYLSKDEEQSSTIEFISRFRREGQSPSA